MKNKKHGRFYKKAHAKGHIEDWALGLEPTPPYVLHRPLADKIEEICRKNGMEIMLVTGEHLIKVGDKQSRV